MTEIIIFASVLTILAFVISRYLDGDFSILEIEEIEKSTVDNMDLRIDSHELCKRTYVTQRITYHSGRVKYKIISYIHN